MQNLIVDLGSDLHLHFGGFDKLKIEDISSEDATVCILAGDIFEVAELKKKNNTSKNVRNFLGDLNSRYEKIFWVLGNHEHYDNDFRHTAKNLKDRLKEFGFDNFVVLDKETYIHNGFEFFGATMWTSMRQSNPIVMNMAQQFMNDYDEIWTNREYKEKLLPEHTCAEYMRTHKELRYFASKETENQKVVITHMAPSQQSISPYYKTSATNDLYYEELSNLIYGSNIHAWFHGHIHDPVIYAIGETLVQSNPRGYFGHEADAYSWKFDRIVLQSKEKVSE